MTDRDPRSEFEDEGIPDLQDGFPEQQWAEDPQQAPLPGDEPVAVDDYGTTETEQREGEPLDGRLRREEPDPALDVDPGEGGTSSAAGRLVGKDEGVRDDTEKDAVADDVGYDTGGFTAEEDAVRIEDQG
jgi:hypothetical protein